MGMRFVDPVPGLGVRGNGSLPDAEKIARMNCSNISRTAGYENMQTFLDLLRQARSSRSLSDSLADIGRRLDELTLRVEATQPADDGAGAVADGAVAEEPATDPNFDDLVDDDVREIQIGRRQKGGAVPAERIAAAIEMTLADRTTLLLVAFTSRLVALSIARASIDSGSSTTLRGAFVVYTGVRTFFHLLLWMLCRISEEIAVADDSLLKNPSVTVLSVLYGVKAAPVTFIGGGLGMDMLVGSLSVLVDRRTTNAENRDTRMNLATDLDRLTALSMLLHAILIFRAT